MKKYVIREIIDWEKDYTAMRGDESHIGEKEITSLYVEEMEQKVENGIWPMLPYECEAEDEEGALEMYIETACSYDYIKPTEAVIEEVE